MSYCKNNPALISHMMFFDPPFRMPAREIFLRTDRITENMCYHDVAPAVALPAPGTVILRFFAAGCNVVEVAESEEAWEIHTMS